MKIPWNLCLLAAWAAATAPALATVPADLIITNAKVFTAESQRPSAEAVAIKGERISFVGSAVQASLLAGPGTKVIDAGGRLLTPGLIEAHTHAGPDIPGQQVELREAMWPGPSPEEVIEAVRAAAPKGKGWLIGTIGPATTSAARDWRSELDAVSQGRPVRLRAWWGHGTILNTAAMRELNIADNAADPIGGWYGRMANGRLNGLVREQAEVIIAQRLTEQVPLQISAKAFSETSVRYAKWGVTTVHKMSHNYRLAPALAALSQTRPAIKWTLYGWGWPKETVAGAWAEFSNAPPPPRNVRIGGIKWILDSTPIERDAFLSAPYSDRPGSRGRSNYSDSQLREILQNGLRRPEQLALHIVGDEEARRVFAAMEKLAPPSLWRARRVRIEHGDGITPPLLAAAKRLGVVVVQNPLHVVPDKDETGRPWLLNRLGTGRVDHFQLLASLIKAKVPLALGSDAGGEAASPFLNMMFAVRYDRNPAEALTREQALSAYTSGAAYAERQEMKKGRIAVGFEADLALLSQDILTVPVEAVPSTRSLLTIVSGAIVHRDPTITAR